MGRAAPDTVLAAAEHPDSNERRGRLCEAYFYLGQHALLAGRRRDARRLFQAVIDTGLTGFVEYHAAQAELRRMR